MFVNPLQLDTKSKWRINKFIKDREIKIKKGNHYKEIGAGSI
jgi:hypothetical protein